jgi:hypothetical protein
MKLNLSKILFIGSLALFLGGGAFGVGLYSGYQRNTIFWLLDGLWEDAKLVFKESENLIPDGRPIHFMQPSRQPGSGVTVNGRGDDGKLILLSGFFDGGNALRLVERDGSVVASWPVNFSELFPDTSHLWRAPETDRNVDLHGALIQPDGSVVFNLEIGGTAKLSRCNEVIWTLAHETHHSIEKAEKGGYWIPGTKIVSSTGPEDFSPFTSSAKEKVLRDNLILRVTEDGVIADQVSVARILYDSGFEAIMTAGGFSFTRKGGWDYELVHVNKIGELSRSIAGAFPEFDAGDLILSLRKYNLVVVVDPDTWRVKWHQTGPWRRQHDPEFNPDGTITVFNNNVYRHQLTATDRSDPESARVSNIMRIDPATRRVDIAYGARAGQEMLSVIRGKHELTPEGGFLITEFEAGRVFEVDARSEIVWEYINRYDDEYVLEMTEGRIYPASYFTVDDWSCSNASANN